MTKLTRGAVASLFFIALFSIATSASAASTPVVSSISPSFGPVAGGTLVTITGSGFSNVVGVAFGNATTTSFATTSDSSLTVQSPQWVAGTVDVRVGNSQGYSATSSVDQFTYQNPAGTAAVTLSSFDPNESRVEPLSTTGLIFTGVRIVAGATENETLNSIIWHESGTASGFQNIATVVNGTSYPTTFDSTTHNYTSTFSPGIVITAGTAIDAYIQGDLGNTANTYAEFDIQNAADISLTGNTSSATITPTDTSNGTYDNTSNHATILVSNTPPFIEGSTVQVMPGSVSLIENAALVPAQSIATSSPNQPLGGLDVHVIGEPIEVFSMAFDVATTTGSDILTNLSLVDQNGNALTAGPSTEVWNGNQGQLDFEGPITLPVGTTTLKVRGIVSGDAQNGTTYQLSTDPSTQWESPHGTVSGASITIPVSTITMNQMTVGTTGALSNDDTLMNMMVNGADVVAIVPSTFSYDVTLGAGTTQIPVVTVTTNDPNATAVVTQASALPGSATILVTAQDGTTKQTYTVNFTVAPTPPPVSSGGGGGGNGPIVSGGGGGGGGSVPVTLPYNGGAAPVTTPTPPKGKVLGVSIVNCNFTRDLYLGVSGADVLCLQQYLNTSGFTIASSGPGSPGNETNYFGSLTQAAVIKWQTKYGVSPAAGYFGPISRAEYEKLIGGQSSSTSQGSTNTVSCNSNYPNLNSSLSYEVSVDGINYVVTKDEQNHNYIITDLCGNLVDDSTILNKVAVIIYVHDSILGSSMGNSISGDLQIIQSEENAVSGVTAIKDVYQALPVIGTAILFPSTASSEAKSELTSLLEDPQSYLALIALTGFDSSNAGYAHIQSELPQPGVALDYKTAQNIATTYASTHPMVHPAVVLADGVANQTSIDVMSNLGQGVVNATLGAIDGGEFKVDPASKGLITTIKGLDKLNTVLGGLQNIPVVPAYLTNYGDAIKAENQELSVLCQNPIGN
ncbi:MAG: IPT/TIG domain-containing protein, partial [Minisyncoccota bacterium]